MASIRIPKPVKILLLVVAVLVGYGHHRWRQMYPYGWSHCCDKQLYFMLLAYAESHHGNFPSGEPTPEASLSLLYATDPGAAPHLLTGKTGSVEKTTAVLATGGRLNASTCGWNYVAGLRSDDDSRLALFWDKEGLGHNGERLPEGGHKVMFVHGFTEYIPASKWDEFLAEQQELREERSIRRNKLRENAEEDFFEVGK